MLLTGLSSKAQASKCTHAVKTSSGVTVSKVGPNPPDAITLDHSAVDKPSVLVISLEIEEIKGGP